jgi:hypothetical protein
MLNVRPAGFADSRYVETVARLDEAHLVFGERVAFGSYGWREVYSDTRVEILFRSVDQFQGAGPSP